MEWKEYLRSRWFDVLVLPENLGGAGGYNRSVSTIPRKLPLIPLPERPVSMASALDSMSPDDGLNPLIASPLACSRRMGWW